MMVLKIGSLSVPLLAALNITQDYAPMDPETVLRTVSGAGLKQSTWSKMRITTRGGGRVPAGLESINTKTQMVLGCITPCSIPAVFATRQATLPAARRSDSGHVPWGFAILADHTPVKTAATMAGNVATLTAVTGAVEYVACYLPQYTVWAFRHTTSGERKSAAYSWELVCEEA